MIMYMCVPANLDPAAFRHILHDVPRGVYAGWVLIHPKHTSTSASASTSTSASHDTTQDYNHVYKTVLSLGYNPTFDTKEETVVC